ncbi:MAG TPA: DUF6512 family protein [Negativicutes bacterium]|nr:DUF6512 family protein [Negativicutes bacterium]
MNNNTIFKWEAYGFFFITLIGSLMHFCFEWSGGFVPLALLCAVNESVWEHLKLGFWPAFFLAALEYISWGKTTRNFIVAKTVSLYMIPIAITAIFYGYTCILGRNFLFLDISSFVLAVLMAQYISYRMITSSKDCSRYNKAALIFLAALTLAFCLLTYFAPDLKPFLDPHTGKPGIPGK